MKKLPTRSARLRNIAVAISLAAGSLGLVLLLMYRSDAAFAVAGVVLLIGGWTMFGLLSSRHTRQMMSEITRLRREVEVLDHRQLERTRRIEAAVDAARVKQSRHEYLQEQALERIESRLRHAIAGPTADEVSVGEVRRLDALFVTSNGAGLGHLTRLLAVAMRLPAESEIEFLTLSRAYKGVAGLGFPISYFPSAEVSNSGARLWNTVFRRHLQRMLADSPPRVVVFDGTVVYEGLLDVCRGYGIPLIWVQRGCWKPEADERYPARRNAASVSDRVIIPGDYGCDEVVDAGPGVEVDRVGPIVLTQVDELMSPQDARAELGLSDSVRHVLVNLGGWTSAGPDTLASLVHEVASSLPEGYEMTMLRSPLTDAADTTARVNVIQRYPIVPCARAFEFTVAAAGYNSVQEAAALQLPTVFVPNDATQTDDQVRRAESAAEQGWAAIARDRQELGFCVRNLSSAEGGLDRMRAVLATLSSPTGAAEAADVVGKVIGEQKWLDTVDRV